MKGKTGSTDVETRHEELRQLEQAAARRGRRSFNSTRSAFHRQRTARRLAVASAGLAMAFLLGVFFVNSGSKLYENWRERRLLHRATALLQEGKLSKAAQMAQELEH